MFKNSADSQPRFDGFIPNIMESKQVYHILHPENGIFVCESNGEFSTLVIPVWSKRYLPYARKYAEGLSIEEISLDEFVNQMLVAMVIDEIAIGINWDQFGFGKEMHPAVLYEQVNKLMLPEN